MYAEEESTAARIASEGLLSRFSKVKEPDPTMRLRPVYRAASAAGLGAAAAGLTLALSAGVAVDAFVPMALSRQRRPLASAAPALGAAPCDVPADAPEAPNLAAMRRGAQPIRSAIVTDASGTMIPLGEAMGDGCSVVVFLRHLG